MIPAFLTAFLFSVSAVAANRSVSHLGSDLANFLRLLVAFALLGLWAHTGGVGLGGAALVFFLLSGLVGFGLGDVGVFHALPRLGARLTLLLTQCLAAPIAGLMEWVWLGSALTPAQMALGATILVGVGFALAPGRGPPREPRALLVGILCGLLSALGQAGGAVLSRKAYAVAMEAGQMVDGLSAAYQRVAGGILVAAIFWWISRSREAGAMRPPVPWKTASGVILLNALSGPVLGVGCYQWALSTTPSAVVLPIVALTPIVVIPLSRIFEGDRPDLRSLAGGAVAVSAAAALAYVTTAG